MEVGVASYSASDKYCTIKRKTVVLRYNRSTLMMDCKAKVDSVGNVHLSLAPVLSQRDQWHIHATPSSHPIELKILCRFVYPLSHGSKGYNSDNYQETGSRVE